MKTLTNSFKTFSILSAMCLALAALSGCASKGHAKSGGESGDEGYEDSGSKYGSLERIHFDFDKSGLTDEAKSILNKDAKTIKDSSSMRVLVEGHCDDRGTAEYNIALGERRAKTAVTYLVGQGIARSRLEMKSWGKEHPLNTAHTEAAYEENRRDEFVIIKK